MHCRSCGHDNKNRSTGKCDNCGFKLDDQNEPLAVQRAALQKPLENISDSVSKDPPDLVPARKSSAGVIGILIFLAGLAGTIFIVKNFERSVYEPVVQLNAAELGEVEIPLDSLPIILGTEIVYVFNDQGTSAAPRTNVDLSLIPEGTRVSFIALGSISIQPVVNYMQQKINGSDFRYLTTDSLYSWYDSTKTEYAAIPILKPVPTPEQDSTVVQPVDLKILFTEEWLRFIVEEYNTDVVEPVTGFAFNGRSFTRVLGQVERSISRRNTDQRPVHITLLFPGTVTLSEAIEMADSVTVYTDSLGYLGYHVKWVNVTE